ncbi:lactate racemase domain-containing protein [Oscillospiraceae bacterium MB08-C2-2]|nr:lactate racemase domain-containing protein [Oscillospiraceae bacterium MB08-C2-2]
MRIMNENITGALSHEQLVESVKQSISEWGKPLNKVLLIPPDFTRGNSGAGILTAIYFDLLEPACHVDILPALGTHVPMTREEQIAFFGEKIPEDRYIIHNWRTDVVTLGHVPGSFVKEVSEGVMDEDIEVQVNKCLTSGEYDLIISIGQVVPHEVVGLANYTKNILVGCGGSQMINRSHMVGAFYGAERLMGRDFSPVRKIFDYAEEHYLAPLPIIYALTVVSTVEGKNAINALYIGRERGLFEKAVALSQKKNINLVKEPIKTCVVYLDDAEFKSTWLGNKGVYRTRMALAKGAQLIILAPGVDKFGEDDVNDKTIRKYGYVGRKKILELVKTEPELQANLSVAAHLIHGSCDELFHITYGVRHLTEAEVTDVGFGYARYDELIKKYDPAVLKDGYNTLENGEEVYYISNPALGLWASEETFNNI